MCQYKTKILHWVDGDGLLCPIDLGFHPHKEKPIQLARIDPPELGAEGNKEGNALKELLTQRNLKGPTLTLEKKKIRKYSCFFGQFHPQKQRVNQWLVDQKLVEKEDYLTFKF